MIFRTRLDIMKKMDLKFINYDGLTEIEILNIKNILHRDSKDVTENTNKINSVQRTEIPVEMQNNTSVWYNVVPLVPPIIANSACNEWQSSTMYSVSANGPMQHGFVRGIIPGSEYVLQNLPPEVHRDASYCKDNGRRNSRIKGPRKDAYNYTFSHANKVQPGYTNEEYVQSMPLYIQVYPEHTVPPQQHPVHGQLYYAPMYPHHYTIPPPYSGHNHPAHQPDSRFVPQLHPALPIQDSNPPTTKPLDTPTQQSASTSATKPADEQINENDKKSADSNANNDNGKMPPVKKTPKDNVKSTLNKNCKVKESNVVADISVNVEVKQNGETENKVENAIVPTVTTTVVSESDTNKVDEVEAKVQQDVTPKDDKVENVIKQTDDSSDVSNVTSPASVPDVPATSTKRTWASLFNNVETKVSSLPQTTAHNAIPMQNGVSKATEKETTVADPATTHQNASSNSSLECKTLPNGELEGFYDDPNLFRMGEFLLQYQMDMQTVSLVPRGLTNRNNYCYINSILQALLACSLFYNLFKAMPHPKNYNKQNKHSTIPSINSLVRFIREFNLLPDKSRLSRKTRVDKKDDITIENGVALEPSYIYTMLKYTSSAGVFPVEGRQEDAEEFLSCLLNAVNDEMLDLMRLAKNEHNNDVDTEKSDGKEEEWRVIGPKNKGSITRSTELERTPLSDIFRGKLRSRVSRPGEQPSDNVQPFFTLQLDIEKADSVKQALDILVSKDRLEGMTCSKTKKQIEAWKQVTLEELPAVLILHLKWFVYKYNGCSKLIKAVEFPIDLKIDNKFLSANTRKLLPKQKQYKLFAVTYHDGKEATKGHYVTDCFHVGYGTWVRYDDTSAKAISEDIVLNPVPPRVPYLLYYRRCDTIGKSITKCLATYLTLDNLILSIFKYEYLNCQHVHHDTTYCKDNGRRNSRIKGPRKDTYNYTFSHANKVQPGYTNEEYVQSMPLYIQVYPEHHTVPPQQHPVHRQLYYTPMYPHHYTIPPPYSGHNHPAHQPDSRFVPQSHPALPIQDSNPPTTKPLDTPTQQSVSTSATKSADEQINENDKKSADSNANNDNGKMPPVKKTPKDNVKSTLNKNCKVKESNVVADISVNVEVKQNGETENKVENAIVPTVTTTVVSESDTNKADEVEAKVQQDVTPKDDKVENVIKQTDDSAVPPQQHPVHGQLYYTPMYPHHYTIPPPYSGHKRSFIWRPKE